MHLLFGGRVNTVTKVYAKVARRQDVEFSNRQGMIDV